jgi:hypothetical protein
MTELEALRAFAQEVMECWPLGDVDGGELQDIAVKHGLLYEARPSEPCGEECDCRDSYHESDFLDGTVVCYRKTNLLTGDRHD